jgi:hypothetical protein
MMAFNILLFLIRKTVDGVVDCKNVLRVEGFFHLLHKVDSGVRQNLLNKSLADLANTVMMGKTAALLEDFISALILNLLVNMNDFFF